MNMFSKERLLEAALRDVTDRLSAELELSHCFGEDGVESCRNIKCRSLDEEDHAECTDELCVYCAGWESFNTVGALLTAIEKMPPTPTFDSFPLGYVAPADPPTAIDPPSADAPCDGFDDADGTRTGCERLATHYNDWTRRCDAHALDGWAAPASYCPHCGAGSADADGELPHYRDCQEA